MRKGEVTGANQSTYIVTAILLLCAATLGACQQAKSKNASASPVGPKPVVAAPDDLHNYVDKDGDIYMYVTAVSEDDRRRGVAAGKVIMYRYLGIVDGKHMLAALDDTGVPIARMECAKLCKIIKMTVGGQVSRLAYSSETVLGSAFEDAINGKLEVANTRRREFEHRESNIEHLIPASFVGEWNEDTAACGTGLNDSALKITPSQLHFYESTGDVEKVRTISSTEILVKSAFSGEGRTWTEEVGLRLPAKDTLAVQGATLQRCPRRRGRPYDDGR